jgi:hypothetical protein
VDSSNVLRIDQDLSGDLRITRSAAFSLER